MSGEEPSKPPFKRYNSNMENLCSRERTAQVLRNNARKHHEYAVSLDKLADWAVGLDDAQDEALWNLVHGFVPR